MARALAVVVVTELIGVPAPPLLATPRPTNTPAATPTGASPCGGAAALGRNFA
jgi:hypothetical protein